MPKRHPGDIRTAPLDAWKLPNVSSKYGAPMGRRSDRLPADAEDWHTVAPRSVHVARVTFQDGCYDNGGAYWGAPANLFLVQWFDGDTFDSIGGEWCAAYVRGDSRAAVVVALDIPAECMASPPRVPLAELRDRLAALDAEWANVCAGNVRYDAMTAPTWHQQQGRRRAWRDYKRRRNGLVQRIRRREKSGNL